MNEIVIEHFWILIPVLTEFFFFQFFMKKIKMSVVLADRNNGEFISKRIKGN